MKVEAVSVRSSREEDIPAITAIYAHHVLNGTGSFETAPPDADEMTRRHSAITVKGLPYLVAEFQGERVGCRQMIGMIGDSANDPSIHLHESLGFARVGALFSVGFKFGRWLDVVFMQRALGSGNTNMPGNT